MNKRELTILKRAYFAKHLKKHPYISLEYYELPAEVLADAEAILRARKQPRKKGIPTRGEVEIRRRVRRETGM